MHTSTIYVSNLHRELGSHELPQLVCPRVEHISVLTLAGLLEDSWRSGRSLETCESPVRAGRKDDHGSCQVKGI